MFSKACEYGIRAVIYIVAAAKNDRRLGIKDICDEIDAPEYFTAKILQNLVKMEIINSSKGPNGGFYIDQNATAIKLIDVVRAIDGNKLFDGCGLGLQKCSEKQPCPIHFEFKSIRDALKKMMEETTVQDLTEDLNKGLVFLKKTAAINR